MGEISGFGGGYESACQDMLEAGVKWLDEHKKADLKMYGFKNVYGILISDSDDAKALEEVITKACDGCSGAMHQAVMTLLAFIAKNGWEKYCEELRALQTKEKSDATDKGEVK